jgi:predicted DCC family thiol-disulfide oxidoreductase YuxK
MTRLSQQAATELSTCAQRPNADIVVYDGQCAFCRAQVARLAGWDTRQQLAFLSLHDDEVQRRWPDLRHEDLMRQMYVIAADGSRYGGARALRYLSTRLRPLWPLAPLLYLPGALPACDAIYSWIASRRYRILGEVPCDAECKVPTPSDRSGPSVSGP